MQRQPIYHPLPATGAALDKTVERLTDLSAAAPLSTPWTLEGDRLVTSTTCK
jgi:hypothetical protein